MDSAIQSRLEKAETDKLRVSEEAGKVWEQMQAQMDEELA